MRTAHRSRRSIPPRSTFAGIRFPADVIVVAVGWYLRFGLSYRDVEELLTERGVEVDHVTIYRWVLRFTPLLAEAADPAGTPRATAGSWTKPTRRLLGSGGTCTERSTSSGRSLTFVSARRDASTAGRFFNQAVGTTKVTPAEVVTDRTATYPMALEELLPAAWHRTDRYANNRVECDHGRLKARLRPMRGPQAGPRRQDDRRRSCVHPEYPARLL